MKDVFIARDKECAALRDCLQSERSEFVIIYGRRRIGKTYLIDRFFNGTYDFTFVGAHRATQKVQLRNFAKALKKYTRAKTAPTFGNWYDAFDALEEYLEAQPAERKKVVFIDEMPWIDTQKSEFVDALENFWNGWANRRTDIMFIASGSATSWMADKLIENQGGLHARITANIYLRPFTLTETEQYLRLRGCRWNRYQILQCYMLFGGVPFYLRQLNVKDSLAQNVDRLFFAVNGVMRMEFDELYHALFTYSDQYINIVKSLANHREGMTRNELAKVCNTAGDRLTKVLKNLERCDFIAKSTQYGNKKKDAIYRLTDLYTEQLSERLRQEKTVLRQRLDIEQLQRIVDDLRAKEASANSGQDEETEKQSEPQTLDVQSLLTQLGIAQKTYRTRFLAPVIDGVTVIETCDISHITIEGDRLMAYLTDGRSVRLEETSLDTVESLLDPADFFRANRQYIVSIRAIARLRNFFNQTKILHLRAFPDLEIKISKDKYSQLREWVNG